MTGWQYQSQNDSFGPAARYLQDTELLDTQTGSARTDKKRLSQLLAGPAVGQWGQFGWPPSRQMKNRTTIDPALKGPPYRRVSLPGKGAELADKKTIWRAQVGRARKVSLYTVTCCTRMDCIYYILYKRIYCLFYSKRFGSLWSNKESYQLLYNSL